VTYLLYLKQDYEQMHQEEEESQDDESQQLLAFESEK